MAKRKYNGCELLSPLYRQIAAEMARGKKKTVVINEYKPKRGKRSKRIHNKTHCMCMVAFKTRVAYVVSGLILFSSYIRRTVGVGEERVVFSIKN